MPITINHQNRQECLNIHVVKEPLKPPANALPCHFEGLVNLLTVCALQNHIARPTRLQFHPKILRFHQVLQVLQERLVFFG